MENTKKATEKQVDVKVEAKKTQQSGAYNERDKRRNLFRGNRRGDRRNKNVDSEFDSKLVSISRVAKAKAGGKTLRIRVMVVVGDKKGRVGVAIAKGKDVKAAQIKAVNRAKKNMIKVQLKGQTIPHEIMQKYGASKVFLKPAAPGTGVICGGSVRSVVEAVGIKDILSKVYGSKNTVTNVYATIEALKKLRLFENKNETK